MRDLRENVVHAYDLPPGEARGWVRAVLLPGRYEVRARRGDDAGSTAAWTPVEIRDGETARVSLALE